MKNVKNNREKSNNNNNNTLKTPRTTKQNKIELKDSEKIWLKIIYILTVKKRKKSVNSFRKDKTGKYYEE